MVGQAAACMPAEPCRRGVLAVMGCTIHKPATLVQESSTGCLMAAVRHVGACSVEAVCKGTPQGMPLL